MTLITVNNAAFDYDQKNIFKGINFEVHEGEIFCLLGPNGSGKTTLLDCILGVLKLKKGRILFDGRDISSLGPGKLSKFLSYVPQRHDCAFPYSVFDIVLMGRAVYTKLFSAPSAEDRRISEEALDIAGISELKERPYTHISGGELQLVMIARALAQATPLIIMDEPTSHLDFRHEMVVLETIVRLVRDKNISVIIATHFPNHAFYFEDSRVKTGVAMLVDGGFMETGMPADILNPENIKRLYGVESNVIIHGHETGKVQKQIIPIRSIR